MVLPATTTVIFAIVGGIGILLLLMCIVGISLACRQKRPPDHKEPNESKSIELQPLKSSTFEDDYQLNF